MRFRIPLFSSLQLALQGPTFFTALELEVKGSLYWNLAPGQITYARLCDPSPDPPGSVIAGAADSHHAHT